MIIASSDRRAITDLYADASPENLRMRFFAHPGDATLAAEIDRKADRWRVALGLAGGVMAGVGVLMAWIAWTQTVRDALTLFDENAALLQAPAQVPASATAASTADAAAPEGAAALTPQTLDATLQRFYEAEANRRVQFSPVDADSPPFDIVLLHTCSLAWDDLDYAGLREHPLLKRFDLVFDNFNAAASYSSPAAIRLLQGACGQSPHAKLYDRPDPGDAAHGERPALHDGRVHLDLALVIQHGAEAGVEHRIVFEPPQHDVSAASFPVESLLEAAGRRQDDAATGRRIDFHDASALVAHAGHFDEGTVKRALVELERRLGRRFPDDRIAGDGGHKGIPGPHGNRKIECGDHADRS